MKKILRYSFTLLLLLSVLIVVPFVFFRDNMQSSQPTETTTTSQFVPSTRPRVTTTTTTAPTSTTVSTTVTGEADGASTTSTTETTIPTTAPTAPPLSQTLEEAFADSLFIGDSRTFGFVSYKINVPGATFFSNEGMSSSAALKRSVEVNGFGTVTLNELLKKKQFKQVFIMFGLNEINNGHSNSSIAGWYYDIIEKVAEIQPDAKIIVQSVLHVTKATNDKNVKSKQPITNKRINELNEVLQLLVDEPYVYYLNVNEAFDDANGALSGDFSAGDGMHIKVRGYTTWRDYLFAKRIL